MPLRDLKCRRCGKITKDVYFKKESELRYWKCPNCHSSDFEKILSPPSLIFKGEGWTKKSISDKEKD